MDFSAPVPCSAQIVHWEDQTQIALDYEKIYSLHRNDLLGKFMQEMDTLPAGPLRDKALAYGVQACLQKGGRS